MKKSRVLFVSLLMLILSMGMLTACDPVSPPKPTAPGDADAMATISATDLKVDATVLQSTANSHWFISYGDTAVEIEVIVRDGDIKDGTSVWSSDAIVLYMSKQQSTNNIADGTLRILATAKKALDVAVYKNNEAESKTAATLSITSNVITVALDEEQNDSGSFIDGYKVNLSVPYAAIDGVTKADKNLTVAAGLINSNGSLSTEAFFTSYGTDYNSVRTYVEITDSKTYAANFWKDGIGWTEGSEDDVDFIEYDATGESIFAIKNSKAANVLFEADIWVGSGDGKTGLVLTGNAKEFLFFIDVNDERNNQWGNHWTRNIGDEWSSEGEPVAYRFLRDGSYNRAYKTLAIVKQGTAIYMFSDDALVMYHEGVFAKDEQVTVGVLSTGLNVRFANETLITETAAFNTKLAELGIGAKSNVAINADLSDWTDAQKSNPKRMAGANGRVITLYAHTNTDGLYIGFEAIHDTYVLDSATWWQGTNLEFKIGTPGRDNQRYISAGGSYSRYETNNGDNSTRDVGSAMWSNVKNEETDKQNTTAELFIPWGMIEGFDANSEYVPIGFAFKTGGEKGNIWELGQDFWYYPEGDPGARNQKVTRNGFATGTDLTIDGSISDWDDAILDNKIVQTGDISSETAAFLGTDGLYIYTKMTFPEAIKLDAKEDDAWKHPNIEFWINDKDNWAYRVLLIDGMAVARGRIAAVEFVLSNDNKTIEFELFLPYDTLPDNVTQDGEVDFRIGSNSMMGENNKWFMPVDPNTKINKDGFVK